MQLGLTYLFEYADVMEGFEKSLFVSRWKLSAEGFKCFFLGSYIQFLVDNLY